MSSTNHTTNYNLPQYVGSDKPAWLGDINPAMSAIDTAMHANAVKAQQGVDDASTANTNIGTMANLDTTEKTNLVGAINEVNTTAGTAQGTANQAIANASAVDTSLNAFMQKFNLLDNVSTSSMTPQSGTIGSDQLTLAQDDTGSIFKIYGQLQFTASGTNFSINKTAIQGLSGYYGVPTGLYLRSMPSEGYIIKCAGYNFKNTNSDNNVSSAWAMNIAVGSDGQIYLDPWTGSGAYTVANGNYQRIWFPPCVYFNASFGDTPSPNA